MSLHLVDHLSRHHLNDDRRTFFYDLGSIDHRCMRRTSWYFEKRFVNERSRTYSCIRASDIMSKLGEFDANDLLLTPIEVPHITFHTTSASVHSLV